MRTFTIGEVLNELKDEFDDVTISKIRFLESEGLIHPDRTESGYRKFVTEDIERLRYVLRSQRDRYLPLKVIKEELDRLDAGLPVEGPAPVDPPPSLEPDEQPGQDAHESGGESGGGASRSSGIVTPPTDVQLSLGELCDTTGLEAGDVRQLRDHGLIRGDDTFDGADLQVAKSAAKLMQLGLEPRHLRMYPQFADRALAYYEQLVLPLLKQRNPDSRAAAARQLEALAREGSALQEAILAREIRGLLRS